MASTDFPWQDWWRAFATQAEFGRLSLAGYQAEYFVWGEGPPLVCIHGLADSFLAFFPLAALLKDRFRVIAYNLPDGYRDAVRLERYSLPELTRDVLRLCKQLRLDSPTLVGHSFGSALALAAVYRYPQAVRRAVTICGFAARPLRPWQKKLLRFGRLLPARWSCLTPYHWPLRQALAEAVSSSRNASEPLACSVISWDNDRTAAPHPLSRWPRVSFRAWTNWAWKLAHTDLRRYLAGIRAPVLVVFSESDPLVPEACQRELLEHLPHAIGYRVPAAGHFPNWSHPHLVAEAIEHFHHMTTLLPEASPSPVQAAPRRCAPVSQVRSCPLLQSWQKHFGQTRGSASPGV